MVWFVNYLKSWNGIAIIPTSKVTKIITTDACMKGIGTSDSTNAYAVALHPHVSDQFAITEIEGFNVPIACHQFLTEADIGSTIIVKCDNNPAVQVFNTGRGRNHVLLDTARKLWLLQATNHNNIQFQHIPGIENDVADILSRALNGPLQEEAATRLIIRNNLQMCCPEITVVN